MNKKLLIIIYNYLLTKEIYFEMDEPIIDVNIENDTASYNLFCYGISCGQLEYNTPANCYDIIFYEKEQRELYDLQDPNNLLRLVKWDWLEGNNIETIYNNYLVQMSQRYLIEN